MSDQVGNTEDRFSCDEAQLLQSDFRFTCYYVDSSGQSLILHRLKSYYTTNYLPKEIKHAKTTQFIASSNMVSTIDPYSYKTRNRIKSFVSELKLIKANSTLPFCLPDVSIHVIKFIFEQDSGTKLPAPKGLQKAGSRGG